MGHQKVGSRYAHRAYLVQGYNRKPEFVVSFEYEHHAVAFFYAQALKERCGAVALAFDVGESEIYFLTVVTYPEYRLFIGLFGRPCVDHVVSEIEVFRYIDMEVFHEVFLGSKHGLF